MTNEQRGNHAMRVVASPVGSLVLCASETGLVSIDVGELSSGDVGTRASGPDAEQILDVVEGQLCEYFVGRRTAFDVALDLRGTEFQLAAWRALCRIPYGTTVSYADQAAMIGAPHATRAVGSANGRNPVPIIVPCHRVVARDGSLGGYSLGLDMKRALLALEGVSVAA
jgi:methylated-DNA-[protein]-cysteine S-methyltransferase